VNRLKTGSGNALARGCGVLFGLLFMLPSLPILIAAAAGLLRDPENNLITAAVAAVCAAPFFLIGAGIVVASLVPWIAGMRVGRPEVTVSNSSLRVGDGFSVAYAQTFKRRAEVRGVGVALVQRERATYTSGSSSTTVSHEEEAETFEIPARTFEAGDVLSFSRGVRIPPTGMHTFKSRHNEIAWLLRVKVDVAGWPDYREYFEVAVQPRRVD
jgi:hypothetical protein